MKKTIFLSILIASAFTSCIPVMLHKEGIRIPKEETPGTILDYAISMKQNPCDVYIFRDSASFISTLRDSVFLKYFLSAMVFSKQGLILNYKDSASCQWSAGSYIGKLDTANEYRTDTRIRPEKLLSSLTTLIGGPAPVFDHDNYDFLVIVTWGKFITKMNERLFYTGDAIKGNQKARIKYLLLNLDMQQAWHLNKKDMIKINH